MSSNSTIYCTVASIDSSGTFTRISPVALDRYRDMFGINADRDVVVQTPQLPVQVTVGRRLLDHVFSEQSGRYRTDDHHVMYSPLTGETLADPDEIWFGRDEKGRVAYRFLCLFTEQTTRGFDYVYHLVIVDTGGHVITAYRLTGGENSFNEKRRGRVMRAAYL